jgi:predicted nucleotidyltransferase
MPHQTDHLLTTQLIEQICTRFPETIGIYLFGTWGTENERSDSDIDLAILGPSPLSASACWNLAQELAITAKKDVDLLDLLSVSTVMRMQVISKGSRIYCRDEYQCESYEMWTYSAYARLNEERKEILKNIQHQGSIYG